MRNGALGLETEEDEPVGQGEAESAETAGEHRPGHPGEGSADQIAVIIERQSDGRQCEHRTDAEGCSGRAHRQRPGPE